METVNADCPVKFQHPKLAGSVILSGDDGDDAKHYQEKQVQAALQEANK